MARGGKEDAAASQHRRWTLGLRCCGRGRTHATVTRIFGWFSWIGSMAMAMERAYNADSHCFSGLRYPCTQLSTFMAFFLVSIQVVVEDT
jgi:hypothetical protein